MLPTMRMLREQLRLVVGNKEEQGHDTTGLYGELEALPDSYDALGRFARKLADLPLRQDWPYIEPNELDAIWAECDLGRPLDVIGTPDLEDSARRVKAAFLGSVCGCVLGKPLEINPTLDEIRTALECIGEWPMRDYVSERIAGALSRPLHRSWTETVRERIAYVAPDDDVNYTIMGMLLLERHGLSLTQQHIRDAWLQHLPIGTTFGPERTLLLKAGINTLSGGDPDNLHTWVTVLNPRDEYCGALIRADAYGYACPGRPALAAELAWRDASWTHRRTGIYGAMFVAAAIATAQVTADRLGVFETALQFVPQRSRFHHIVADSLDEVRQASDWLDGYRRIHAKYRAYSHCLVYQEVGTLINTLRFAQDVGDGICKQVSQGNDTDSFGATAGSILGAYFGPDGLEERWLAPFHDDIHTALAWFYERSLSKLAKRMGELPGRIAAEPASGVEATEAAT
jgi:ADP-ribosylglycohydrolase